MPNEELRVTIVGSDGVSKTFLAVEQSAGRMGATIEQSGKDGSRALQEMGRTSEQTARQLDSIARKAAVVGTAVGAGMFVATNAASDLNEAVSAVDTVFGDAADTIHAFADDSAEAFGLSARASEQYAATLGALLQSTGIVGDAAADMSVAFLGAAADIASFFNVAGGAPEVLEAIRSGLVGEIEPLRRFGILLSDTAVAAKAFELGFTESIEKTTASLTEQEKVQARAAIILDSLGAAQGDFARTSDQLANSQRIARAELENAAATLGQTFVPAATTAVQGVTSLIQGFNDLPGPVQETVAVLTAATGGLALLTAGGAKAASTFLQLRTAARAASGAAGIGAVLPLLTGPVGLAIGAAVAGVAIAELTGVIDLFGDAAEGNTPKVDALTAAIDRLAAAGDPDALRFEAIELQFRGVEAEAQHVIDRIDEIAQRLPALQAGAIFGDVPPEQASSIAVLGAELAALETQIGDTEEATRAFAEAEAALGQIIDSSGPGKEHAIETLEALFALEEKGLLTEVELAEAIVTTANRLGEYDRQAIEATESTDALAAATERATESVVGINRAMRDASTRLRDYEDGAGRAALADEAQARQREAATNATVGLSNRLRDYEDSAGRAAAADEQLAKQREQAVNATVGLSNRLRDYEDGAGRAAAAEAELTRRHELRGLALADLLAIQGADFVAPELFDAASLAPAIGEVDALNRAYVNLGLGILTASDAQTIFKGTQDELIASQSVYAQQQSEYQGQLNALQAAEDLLNERRARGVELTAEQEDFLNRVDAAQERLVGGTEDAILAEGQLALQYAENVRQGDALNRVLEGQSTIVGTLIDIVVDLIAQLHGIPSDVKTDIELVGADTAIGQAASLAGTLASIPLSKRIDIVTAFSQTGTPPGLAGIGPFPFLHGGIVPAIDHAQHGIVGSGRLAVVGEAGPEIVRLPGGSQVSPSPASRATLAGMGKRPVVINMPIYGNVYADDLEERIGRAIRSATYAEGRSL